MAKAKKNATVAVVSLAAIVAAGDAGMYAQAVQVQEFEAAGLVETNPALVNEAGEIAVRATAAGYAEINKGAQVTQEINGFQLDDNVELPTLGARNARKSAYPFEVMAVGQSFFVANTAEKPDAKASMASTVSAANARYTVADPSGATETIVVKEFALDAEGKRIKDAEGHWIVTSTKSEVRAKTVPTRRFDLRAVDETAQGRGKGARIWRTA